MSKTEKAELAPIAPVPRAFVPPSEGEVITSLATGNSYWMGKQIGEGNFGLVYDCWDNWRNSLAAKVLKATAPYENVRTAAIAELQKLLLLRHPHITYVFDAFESRETFYIVTERCYGPVADLFTLEPFDGKIWLMPIARCLLQAMQYVHSNGYAHQDIHEGNVFTAFSRDEMQPTAPGAIQFKLGDLGVSRVFGEINATNTLADWMRPPEAIDSGEYGPMDYRIDIYHVGLLLLQLALSKRIQFSREEILQGRPRELALELAPPLNFALEKALRRHVPFRTASAMELWRDLNSPPESATPESLPPDSQPDVPAPSGPAEERGIHGAAGN